jgi:hypothetical protein
MPTTIRPSLRVPQKCVEHVERNLAYFFCDSCPKEDVNVKAIVRSTFDDMIKDPEIHIAPSPNGFVRAATDAYNKHHHLMIRPDDVWCAILSQLSFYICSHAEEMRHFFVAHEGKLNISVLSSRVLAESDVSAMVTALAKSTTKFLKDPELLDWILPNFSTTTETDKAVASAMIMGSFREYFNAGFYFYRGIPSVTLLGAREDWVQLASRVDRLSLFSPETKIFHSLLEPIMRYFIRSFDEPEHPDIIDFWGRIAHESSGSGSHYISGWLTAFCFWDAKGNLMYRQPEGPVELDDDDPNKTGCILDGVKYHRINSMKIPVGWVSCPLTVHDDGAEYRAALVAGSLAIRLTSSGEPLDPRLSDNCNKVTIDESGRRIADGTADRGNNQESPGGEPVLDTLQPMTGWFLYEVDVNEDDGYGYWRDCEGDWIPDGLAKALKTMTVENTEHQVA